MATARMLPIVNYGTRAELFGNVPFTKPFPQGPPTGFIQVSFADMCPSCAATARTTLWHEELPIGRGMPNEGRFAEAPWHTLLRELRSRGKLRPVRRHRTDVFVFKPRRRRPWQVPLRDAKCPLSAPEALLQDEFVPYAMK